MTSRCQNTVFITFASGMCLSRYFLIFYFMYAMPIPVQTKVHFKSLQSLALAYDMGFLSFAFDV